MSGSRLNKALSVILTIAILGTIGVLIFIFAFPKGGEKFTEFYILGLDGKATDYPEELRPGETGKVIVGIVNHEQQTVSYRVEVRINGTKKNEVDSITLDNEAKWEDTISFTPDTVGDGQKIEFLLFKNNEPEYNLGTHLWIDVKSR